MKYLCQKTEEKEKYFMLRLFPIKLKYYLEKAKKKGNKKNINITFVKLEQKADTFYCVVKQF